jgi:hypothetical protein
MKAPAKTVTVSRAEASERNILNPFCIFNRTDHRVRAIINAGGVPIGKYPYDSV